MEFEIWISSFRVVLLKLAPWEYLLLALYTVLTVLLLIRFRHDFAGLTRRRLLLFAGLLIAPLLVNRFLVLTFPAPDLLPPPDVPFEPHRLAAPLLGAIPILAAAAWLGAGPALLVSLVSGILRADVMTGGIAEPTHFVFFGLMVALLLRQDYRGRLPLLARQPLCAVLLVTPLSKVVLLFSIFAHVADVGLAGFDYAVTLTKAYVGPELVEGLAAALVVQALYLRFPRLRPVHVGQRPAPYSRSLNRKFLFMAMPVLVLTVSALLYAVITLTLPLATAEAVNAISRDASVAAEGVPYFISTGQGLLTNFASDDRLWSDDPSVLAARLESDLRSSVFFTQLMLLERGGRLLAIYPPTDDPRLTTQEEMLLRRVFEEGALQISTAHRSVEGEAILSFLIPVEPTGGEGELSSRVLVGRTYLDVNPLLNHILGGLQWARGQSEGFIVDLDGHIVSHADSRMLLSDWQVEKDRPHLFTGPRGWAYESRNPRDNTRQIVYYMPVEGYPWAIVVQLPYEVVLARARAMATPLLIVLVLFGSVLAVVIPVTTRLLTRPLDQLAVAAERIAEGDLTQPVQVAGDDEVGRVGKAFESMRARLKARMDDLALLLETGQTVSATLDLATGMAVILEGMLRATEAQVARTLLLSEGGEPQMTLSQGEFIGGLETLDRVLAAAVKGREQPLVVENLARARTLGIPESLNGTLKTVVALPVRAKDRLAAVMWVGYTEARRPDDLEVHLLSTLATQAAALVENARLFRAAEDGRRQLAAILNSTTDAVLVTNQENRILLLNPAAERAFGIAADAVTGQRLEQTELEPALAQAFSESLALGKAPSGEIPLPDGRTLHASLAIIWGADGEQIGRVAVMHDVTQFKELDEMRSEFLATVSHDLRAPLIYMRGYANMLLAMSPLDDKQREYVEKILYGVEQINELVSDLLDLGRIETGVGLEHRPCHLAGVLIEAVDSMRARAVAKQISLRLEPSADVAIIAGDAALLRQAVSNLVDNAIKYTPNGGIVTVGLTVRADGEGKRAVIHITDTGIGIAPEDQARLFEKFYRIKRRGAADEAGTGLGLALVKSIVERHGGKVWVDSELNEGSTFYISLPLSDNKTT